MTDRERFNRQMHFQSTDRCLNWEMGYWPENFFQWNIFVNNGVRNNTEAKIFFALDKIANIGFTNIAGTAAGENFMCPPMKERVLEVRGKTQVIMNTEGLLAEVPLESGRSSVPHYLRSSIVTPRDWKKIKEEHFDINHPGRKLNIPALKKKHLPDEGRDYPLGIHLGSMIGKVRNMLTFEGLAYAIYDYPEMVEDMVETCCQIAENLLDQLLPEFKFDYAKTWEDICFKNGPIVGIDFFRDVVMPRYKRLDRKLKAYGIDIFYTDCDGDVRPLLPYFLEGGVNCFYPHEVNSCGHPGELLDKYQGQLRIMGGVDKMILGKGKKAIKEYLKTLEKYVKRGGFIPFCDHHCPPNVKPDDYLYYLDLKETMFGKV